MSGKLIVLSNQYWPNNHDGMETDTEYIYHS